MSAPYFLDTYVNETPREWQDFVDGSSLCNIFQTRYWAKAMRKAGLQSLLIVARDEEGDIKGGILGVHQKYSFLKLHIVPALQVWGGPLAYDITDRQLIETLIRHFDERAKKSGTIQTFIRSFAPLDDIFVHRLNYIVEKDRLPCTVIINLDQSTEQIWKQLQERGRRGIRKATKKGVTVEEGTTIDDLIAYYQIAQKTGERLEISPPSFRVIQSLWRTFSHDENFKLFLAKYGTRVIAGVFVVRWQDKMWGWHGASLAEYWDLNANLLIHWHIMEWGAKNQLKTYDLMGIPCQKNSNHPKYGLYLFKTQFGGEIVRHGEYVKLYSPFKSILLSRVVTPVYRRFLRLS